MVAIMVFIKGDDPMASQIHQRCKFLQVYPLTCSLP